MPRAAKAAPAAEEKHDERPDLIVLEHPRRKPNQPPEESYTPVGSVEAVRKAGKNLRAVPTCAVGGEEHGELRGCRFGKECAQGMFGLPENGGFGPKSPQPDTPGTRPHYIGFYHATKEGLEHADVAPCFTFMNGLWDRYLNQDRTGELIEIIAQEGETIMRTDRGSNQPGATAGDQTIWEEDVEVVVPTFPDYEPNVGRRLAAAGARKSRNRIAAERRREKVKQRMAERFGGTEKEPEDAKP